MMILIGQYDSPFVRRVGIALTLYGLAFEHRPWSVFGDADRMQPFNPLIRVPTLVLDDGFVLTDSHMILDHLDSLVPEAVAMFPRHEPARHHALKVATLGTGLAEKAVSLFYERSLHDTDIRDLDARCRTPDRRRAGKHWRQTAPPAPAPIGSTALAMPISPSPAPCALTADAHPADRPDPLSPSATPLRRAGTDPGVSEHISGVHPAELRRRTAFNFLIVR